MYGKIFEDIFDSSLSTDGDFITTYVFMSMIVLADEHGFVHIGRDALFERLRFPNEFIIGEAYRKALSILEAPDPESNLPYDSGRRIIPLSEIEEIEGNRGWYIVNYLHYRNKGKKEDSQTDRREWMRKYMANRRKKENENKDLNAGKQSVNTCKQISAYTDTDTDTDTVNNIARSSIKLDSGFEEFWQQYPKKRSKKKALDIWKRKKLHTMAVDLVQDVMNRVACDKRWLSGFSPDPTTYLNQERWTDELRDSVSGGNTDPYFDMIRQAKELP